jgi:hypothetical protein
MPKIKDKRPSKRFREAARELGADEDGDVLGRIFYEMVKSKPK